MGSIRYGFSDLPDPERAIDDLRHQLAQPDPALVILFFSPHFDRARLAEAVARQFQGVPVVGCTTAGEITPMGYRTGTITGISLSHRICQAEAILFERLSTFSFSDGIEAVRSLCTRMAEAVGSDFAERSFAMLMVDGMSGAEESILSALNAGLMDIPLFGGSAGDSLDFHQTFVLKDGEVRSDAAVLVLIHTPCPFRVFKTQHFVGSDVKMVITGADPVRRIVTEINAEPAGREFARMVGLEVEELTPLIFATHPVVVKVGGTDYVRSIQKVNPDGSLSFFCAIDEGLVLSVGRSVDPCDNVTQLFADIGAEIGPPDLVIGCECVLRLLEVERSGLKQRMESVLAAHRVVGFNTYGEQFNAMHVNQTFTGVALACPVP